MGIPEKDSGALTPPEPNWILAGLNNGAVVGAVTLGAAGGILFAICEGSIRNIAGWAIAFGVIGLISGALQGLLLGLAYRWEMARVPATIGAAVLTTVAYVVFCVLHSEPALGFALPLVLIQNFIAAIITGARLSRLET